jgi:hypothetical protein
MIPLCNSVILCVSVSLCLCVSVVNIMRVRLTTENHREINLKFKISDEIQD